MSFPMRFLGLSFISSSQEAIQKKDINTIWNIDPRAMVNVSEKLAFKRVKLPTDNGKNADWHNTFVYAWEAGKTVDQMERIIWVDDPVRKVKGWFRAENDGSIYHDPTSQEAIQWIVTNGVGTWKY